MDHNVKQRILSEAEKFVFTYGVKSMTMDELAKRIGISKRTIYETFEDKDALITAVIQERKLQNEKNSVKLLNKFPTIIHVFFHLIKDSGKQDLFSKADEIKRYHPLVYQKEIVEYKKNRMKQSEKVFELGIKQGVFRSDIELGIVSDMFHTISHQLFENESSIKENYSLEKIFYTFILIFLRGISTPKGLKIIDSLQKTEKLF